MVTILFIEQVLDANAEAQAFDRIRTPVGIDVGDRISGLVDSLQGVNPADFNPAIQNRDIVERFNLADV